MPVSRPSSSDPARTEPELHVRWLLCRYAKDIDDEDEESFGIGVGSGTFPDFLRGELVNIRSTRGIRRSEAEKANNEFARRRRDALRQLLRAAARRNVLPWGTTRLGHFADGRDDSKATAFIDLDEDLEGDSEFNPIELEPEPPHPKPTQPKLPPCKPPPPKPLQPLPTLLSYPSPTTAEEDKELLSDINKQVLGWVGVMVQDFKTHIKARQLAAQLEYQRDRVLRGLDIWDARDELYPKKTDDWLRSTAEGRVLLADEQLRASYDKARDGTVRGGQLQKQIFEKELPALEARVARAAAGSTG